MLSNQTASHWELDEPSGHAEFAIDIGDGDCVAEIGGSVGLGYSAEEIARRMVACWNACRGRSIESLE